MGALPFPVVPGHPTYVSALFWHEETQSLIAGSKNQLGIVQLTRDESTKATITSHGSPITCIAYSDKFNQVATADSSGLFATWDLLEGKRLLQVSDAHGQSPIESIAFGRHGKWLLTGVGILVLF
jgi:WD40 repeat protein